MALERTYTIPLRKEWLKAPKYKRAKKTIAALKAFLKRHMKSDNVKLGTHLNLEIWKHGMKNPPGKVRVNVVKDDKNVVTAELYGVAAEEEKKAKRKIKNEAKDKDEAEAKGKGAKVEAELKEAERKEEEPKEEKKLKGAESKEKKTNTD